MTRKIFILIAAFAILFSGHMAAAQQAGKVYRIGFLTASSVKPFKHWLAAFRQGLQELGYVEGKNIVIEERYAAGKAGRLPALAAELVGLKLDVIVIHGTSATRAAKQVAGTIPIVFSVVADPVGSGFVASLSKPGGNITGVSDYHSALVLKRLQLLKEVVPSLSRVAVFWHPDALNTVPQLKTLKAIAPALGVTLLPVKFKQLDDFNRASAAFRKARPDALNVFGYALMSAYLRQIAEFAIKNRLPTIGTTGSMAAAGFLMSYGVKMPDLYRRAASFVDRILKGAKPADLPVELPTRFYLTINPKTAKALGITFPPSILLRATHVIE